METLKLNLSMVVLHSLSCNTNAYVYFLAAMVLSYRTKRDFATWKFFRGPHWHWSFDRQNLL